jgi:hypothetical protein
MRTSTTSWRQTVQTVFCASALLATFWHAGAAGAADNPFRTVDGFVECTDEYDFVGPASYGSCEVNGSCSPYGSCDVSGSCSPYGSCDCTTDCNCADCCGPSCSWGHCTSFWGEGLYLHATGADMVHAQQQNGIGGAGTVPYGKIGAVDPNYEPGFRIGGVLGLSDTSSFGASYMFYESSAVDTIVPPDVPGGGGAVGSLVHHPGAAITASVGPVNAQYDIDFQLAEFECRRLIFGDSCGYLNYSVGARFAHLEQEFSQTGIFSAGTFGTINTATEIDFDGGGAMFGLDGERRIGRRGLSLYGNVGVSPMVGQFSSDYLLFNDTTDTVLALAQWKDDRFVTLLDFELGLAWTSCNQKWRVSGGYLAQFWFNTLTTPEFVDAVQANEYADRGDTLSFDGATARIERRF